MPDYGSDLIEHFLLQELLAEGHIEQVGRRWMYLGDNHDYVIDVTAVRVDKVIRLSED